MRKKIGTSLDEDIIKQAKLYAVQTNITFNTLVEEAIVEYLARRRKIGKEISSVVEKTKGSIKVPKSYIDSILEEDDYEEL
jgi:hypothetical protein